MEGRARRRSRRPGRSTDNASRCRAGGPKAHERGRSRMNNDPVAFNHVGQCVTDLDRSKRFYCELLGFTLQREISPPDDVSAQLLGLTAPLGMTAAYLGRDGLVLELLHFSANGQTAGYERR